MQQSINLWMATYGKAPFRGSGYLLLTFACTFSHHAPENRVCSSVLLQHAFTVGFAVLKDWPKANII